MSRILVLEDNEINARLFRDVLTYRGHLVIEARTVAEARAQLAQSLPDLVLTDLRLPDGGGDQLLREIRADPARAHLVVVVVTASAMGGDATRIVALGFDGYVSKPINLSAFERAVDDFLALAAKRPPATPPPARG